MSSGHCQVYPALCKEYAVAAWTYLYSINHHHKTHKFHIIVSFIHLCRSNAQSSCHCQLYPALQVKHTVIMSLSALFSFAGVIVTHTFWNCSRVVRKALARSDTVSPILSTSRRSLSMSMLWPDTAALPTLGFEDVSSTTRMWAISKLLRCPSDRNCNKTSVFFHKRLQKIARDQ